MIFQAVRVYPDERQHVRSVEEDLDYLVVLLHRFEERRETI